MTKQTPNRRGTMPWVNRQNNARKNHTDKTLENKKRNGVTGAVRVQKTLQTYDKNGVKDREGKRITLSWLKKAHGGSCFKTALEKKKGKSAHPNN